jgi:hypothetical protein
VSVHAFHHARCSGSVRGLEGSAYSLDNAQEWVVIHLRKSILKALLSCFESADLGANLVFEILVDGGVVERPCRFESVPVDLAEVVDAG